MYYDKTSLYEREWVKFKPRHHQKCNAIIHQYFPENNLRVGFRSSFFWRCDLRKVIVLAGMGTITGTLLAWGIVICLPVAYQNVTGAAFWLAQYSTVHPRANVNTWRHSCMLNDEIYNPGLYTLFPFVYTSFVCKKMGVYQNVTLL